jgi:hypothetical protein
MKVIARPAGGDILQPGALSQQFSDRQGASQDRVRSICEAQFAFENAVDDGLGYRQSREQWVRRHFVERARPRGNSK